MWKTLFVVFIFIIYGKLGQSISDAEAVEKSDQKLVSTLEKVSRVRRGRHSPSDGYYKPNAIDPEEFLPIVDNEEPATARPYKYPGHWATPAPDSGIDLGFTPVQTYLQVRRTNSVQRLPRSEAIKEAASEDEIQNAHRLKEVLRTKKIQEVYSEEGYEDSAFDHGNHERHAEHDEEFQKYKAGKYKVKDPVQHIDDVSDAESQVVLKKDKPKRKKPTVSRNKMETSSIKVAYMEDGNSKPVKKEWNDRPAKPLSRKYKRAPKITSKELKSVAVKRDFASQGEDFWTFPSSFEELSVNKWGANFEPVNQGKLKDSKENVGTNTRVRIPPVPTFGYIHSLTDAYYGSQAPMAYHHPKPIPSYVINLTESIRAKPKKGFEPRRLNKRIKRDDEEDERRKEAEKYAEELTKNLNEQEKIIIGSAFKNLGVANNISEKYPFLTPPPRPKTYKLSSSWPKSNFDEEKYPYFNMKGVNPYSPLKYASHPREFPIKSGRAMEFYESRDRAMHCDPISVSLDDAPKEISTRNLAEQPGAKKRIVGLGDKIRCLKVKYFGEDPLDSPFFIEDELEKEIKRTGRADEGLKFHSSYQYWPNKTIDIFVKEKVLNDSKVESTKEQVAYEKLPQPAVEFYNSTQDLRKIPFRETFMDLTTAAPIMGMRPPPIRYVPFPLSIIRLPRKPKPPKLMTRIKYKYNCLQPVTRMTISERMNEDVMFDCQDVTLIQTLRDGNPHFQIIPKRQKSRRSLEILLDEPEGIRAGEVIEEDNALPKRSRRSTNLRRKSQLFPNKSLLDKLIKKPFMARRTNETINHSSVDLGVRAPEEIEIAVTTRTAEKPKMTTTTTTTTTISSTPSSTATQSTVKFEPKPLKRLSGRDFLVRYHKNKGSKTSKQPDKNKFWKLEVSTVRNSIATLSPVDAEQIEPPEKKEQRRERTTAGDEPKFEKSTKGVHPAIMENRAFDKTSEEEPRLNTKRDEPEPTPVLLYIVDESTGRGQWVTEDPRSDVTSHSSTEKTNGRQLKKHNARKLFFTKKLKKAL